jgi:uncharacterized protein (TIGR02118 family)
VAKLIILYGHPTDPAAFEEYYTNRHLPYAASHMPNVRGAETHTVVDSPNGGGAPFYRIAQMSYDSVSDIKEGITSPQGRAVLADLDTFATGGVTTFICETD